MSLPYYAGRMPPSPISGQTLKSRIVGLPEVVERTHWSKSKIYRDMKAGKFPKQAKNLEGSRSAGWFEDEIDEFLEARRPESSLHGNRTLSNDASKGDVAVLDTHHLDRTKFLPSAMLN